MHITIRGWSSTSASIHDFDLFYGPLTLLRMRLTSVNSWFLTKQERSHLWYWVHIIIRGLSLYSQHPYITLTTISQSSDFLVNFLSLTYICLVDPSTLISWMSPFPILGVSGVLFHFYSISTSYSCKQWRPWSDSAFCGIWSGSALFACVPKMGL